MTSAYAPFVNGGNKIDPNLILRIQDRRGKTIFNEKRRECIGCDKFIDDKTELPKIVSTSKKVISEETAYQMTSILQGTVERGTAKKLKNLKVPLAGKTGTTNDNYDAWFIGFSSNIVIGVYIGYDSPKSLGKTKQDQKLHYQFLKILLKMLYIKMILKTLRYPKIFI